VNKKRDKKVPKRNHKSDRDKLKLDKQNDLCTELGNLLCVALERNELHDDNSMLHSEILELQNKLRSYDADGRQSCFESPAFPQQQPVVIEQHYGTTPSELQLFPESTTSEDSEPSQEHGISDHVTRPQAKYPTPTATLTVNLFPVLPGRQDQQCSSGTTGTSEEDCTGRS
ncbi:hypothetical protein EE612_045098, partial [Oryza sativa]